jgi:acyl-CoA synthetase (AMP-forming)/AMP-acid ligase II
MTALHGKDHERGRQPTRSVAFGDGHLTIADGLEHHAHTRSDRRAFSFVQDGGGAETRTWAELAAGARAVAAVLADLPRTREQPRASLITALARSGCHITALLDCQLMMATAATYALNRWRSSGGVVAPIPAAPYPDDRYQTKMIWWDRRDFIRHAEPGQVAKILTEGEQLTREVYRRGDLAVTWRDVV